MFSMLFSFCQLISQLRNSSAKQVADLFRSLGQLDKADSLLERLTRKRVA